MTEEMNDNEFPPQSSEADVFALLKKMQQQLVYLEKKIDTLINQSHEKPNQGKGYQDRPYREKRFPKPAYSSGRPQRSGYYRGDREQEEGSGEGGFRSGHSYKKRRQDDDRGFRGPKREYSDDRDSGQDRPFKKKFGEKKFGFAGGKKPFFKKHKD